MEVLWEFWKAPTTRNSVEKPLSSYHTIGEMNDHHCINIYVYGLYCSPITLALACITEE